MTGDVVSLLMGLAVGVALVQVRSPLRRLSHWSACWGWCWVSRGRHVETSFRPARPDIDW
jgi:hypothetical protein